MTPENRVQFNLSMVALAQITIYAQAHSLTIAAAAKRLLEQALASLALPTGAQQQAQAQVIKFVQDIVDGYRARDDWNEHVTLAIFRSIRAEMLDVYEVAIAGGNKTQMNREIGRRVRVGLNAKVRFDSANNAIYLQLPRNAGELIKTYTLLYRAEAN